MSQLAYVRSHHKRCLIEKNLQLAYGASISAPERACITRGAFYAFWDEMFCWADRDSSRFQVQISGMEYLQGALERGHGAILWESNSIGKRLLSKYILHEQGISIVQIHALAHVGGIGAGGQEFSRMMHHVIHPYFHNRTCEFVDEVIYLDEKESFSTTRALLDRLKKNKVLCIAAEGPMGYKHITLPFLGGTSTFATGIVNLAKLADAPLIPMFCTPMPNGSYLLEFLAPMQLASSDKRKESIQNVLEAYKNELEARIRRNPGWSLSWDRPRGE